MSKERIRISCKTGDREEDRYLLERIRRELYSEELVNVEPENPAFAIRRAPEGAAFMEFATSRRADIDQLIARWRAKKPSIALDVKNVDGPLGDPCINCGHTEQDGDVPAVCPSCEFRDTSPCPHCNADVSRQAYRHIAGKIEECPQCHRRVRLEFNEPLLKRNGEYNEPVVVVEAA